MTTHPDIINSPTVAKAAAAAIAVAAHCNIVQLPNGHKGLRLPSGNVKECKTWLGVYELVFRIRKDQVEMKK